MKIWSLRYTPAKGTHMQAERDCNIGNAQAWLEVFRADEPRVIFIASVRKPSIV
jgi:hypothetical protein